MTREAITSGGQLLAPLDTDDSRGDRSRWFRHLPALVVLLVGVGVRAWWITSWGAQLDGDEATTGVMARRIAHGSENFLYFAGQQYNGSLEQYLQAFVIRLGAPTANEATLFSVSIFLSAVTAALVYLTALRLFRDDVKALLSLVVFSAGSFYLIFKGTRSDGSYDSTQLFAVLGFYAVLRLPEEQRRGRLAWAAVFGLCSGLCLWGGLSGILLLLPAFLWGVFAIPRVHRLIPAALIGAVVGALPALVWIARHGHLQQLGGPQPHTTVAKRLANLSGPLFRQFLGVANSSGRGGWPAVWQDVAVAVVVAAFAVMLVHRLVTARRTFADTGRRLLPTDALFLVPPVTVVFFAVSAYAWYLNQPRYLFVDFPFLCWFLASCIPTTRRLVVAPIAVLLATVTVATTVWELDSGVTQAPGAYVASRPSAAQYAAVCRYLSAHDERFAYADYWTGMPLQYYCPAVTISPLSAGLPKFPDLRRTVDAAPSYVFIAPAGDVNAKHGINRTLTGYNVSHTVATVGPLVVYADLGTQLKPWQLHLARKLP